MATHTFTQMVRLSEIQTSDSLRLRETIDQEIVAEIAEDLRNGAQLPPLELVHTEDGHLFLWDGHHQIKALLLNGEKQALARIQSGTLSNALIWACERNSNHGVRLSRADKRRAVTLILQDPAWADASDNWVAKIVAVDHKTVAAVRRELGIPQSEHRRTVDGRLVNVLHIGLKKAAQKPEQSRGPENQSVQATQKSPTVPSAWPEFDGSIADDVPQVLCPHCAQPIPTRWLKSQMEEQS